MLPFVSSNRPSDSRAPKKRAQLGKRLRETAPPIPGYYHGRVDLGGHEIVLQIPVHDAYGDPVSHEGDTEQIRLEDGLGPRPGRPGREAPERASPTCRPDVLMTWSDITYP